MITVKINVNVLSKKKKTDKKDGRRSDVDILLWTIFYTTVGL